MTSLVETVVERPGVPPFYSLTQEMYVERGTKADWDLLHDLHYKAEKLPIGPRFWRLVLRGETIGVLVTGTPKGLLKERHIAFPRIKPTGGDTRLTNTNRYHFINANFRVISRFVLDTMYRGIGAGYRMMNLVSRMEGNTYMEIQSSMSKFNSFGQKAGFSFVKPMNANMFEKGMRFMRGHFDASPQDFEAMLAEITNAEPARRHQLTEACRGFYLANSSQENTGAGADKAGERVAAMSEREIVKALQQVCLASPLYGVWKCPDKDGVPDRLPLAAFDCQGPREKLAWQPSPAD